ncbi:IMP dehydrogenase [Elusimicrobiota bacterium]
MKHKKVVEQEGLSFDDVLLIPRRSSLATRKDARTNTQITKTINIAIPIVSSNMDTVTESRMAIAMARLGGLGIVHRFMSIEDEVSEVSKVKRTQSIIIEEPHTIGVNETVTAAQKTMKEWGISGLLVVGSRKGLSGIITSKDTLFIENPSEAKVSEVMTPRDRLVTAPRDIGIEAARKILEKHRIEKLPLTDSNGKLCGLITSKDIIAKKVLYPHASKDSRGRLLVGGAIGVKDDYLERAQALVEAGCDVLVLDVAHGHSDQVIAAIKKIKGKFDSDIQLIAGNVATYEGARELAQAGADSLKVGIGPGSICTTRVVTGCGVPQVTALIESGRITQEFGVPVISDGGIRTSGDLTKALAAGASAVMMGSMLAGTEESPGTTIIRNGVRYRICRGMASLGAAFGRAQRTGQEDLEDAHEIVAEGVEALVPYRGKCEEVIWQLIGGLKSGMSYCGAKNLKELQEVARFIKISRAAYFESLPHDVDRI